MKQQTLELNTQLYTDNKRRAELGALAEIDIIQAEAEMKSSQQDVTTAETQVMQQEMILKSAITRSGFNNAAVVSARIVPTDHFDVPQQDAIQPTQDMVSEAFQKRPEIEQSQIGLEDARINMLGTKNNLLPSLSVFANLSNNGLAGSVNTLPVSTPPVSPASRQPPVLPVQRAARSSVFVRTPCQRKRLFSRRIRIFSDPVV